MKTFNMIAALMLCGASAMLIGCNSTESQQPTVEHSKGEIVMEPADAQRFGVVTDTVVLAPFEETIAASGEILSSPSDVGIVVAPKAGVVTLNDLATVGQQVGRGRSIASISVSRISGGDVDAAALAAVNAARREVERMKPLVADGIVTRKEFNAAQAAYEAAKAQYSPAAAGGACPSPIAGVVSKLLVANGTFVEAGQPIAEISSSNNLMLRIDLPERFRSEIPSIDNASIRLPYADKWINLRTLDGKLIDNAQSLPPAMAGYLPIYFSISNDGSLSIGSYVEARLISSQSTPAIALPKGALIEQQGQMFVYVKVSEHGYEKRPVTIGNNNGLRVEITSGLRAGEEVVVDGAIMIKLAESSGTVPEGHSHHH